MTWYVATPNIDRYWQILDLTGFTPDEAPRIALVEEVYEMQHVNVVLDILRPDDDENDKGRNRGELRRVESPEYARILHAIKKLYSSGLVERRIWVDLSKGNFFSKRTPEGKRQS